MLERVRHVLSGRSRLGLHSFLLHWLRRKRRWELLKEPGKPRERKTEMRKRLFVVSIVICAFIVGFISVRWTRSTAAAFPPHTIVYRLTFYDESEKVVSASTLIRQVFADGTWKHTQINPEGNAVYSNGKIKSLVVTRPVDSNASQHLGYRYIAEKNRSAESWVSPDLQDLLMFSTFRADGSRFDRMEALHISSP